MQLAMKSEDVSAANCKKPDSQQAEGTEFLCYFVHRFLSFRYLCSLQLLRLSDITCAKTKTQRLSVVRGVFMTDPWICSQEAEWIGPLI